MVVNILHRVMLGIAYGGIAMFIAITILMLNDIDISSAMTWYNMVGSYTLGIYFGMSSFIFENEQWSMLKQTCIHFILSVIAYYLTAFPLGWVPFTRGAVFVSFIIFTFVYIIFWFSYSTYYKREIRKMNEAINKEDR